MEDYRTQEEKDQDFLNWCMEQYLDGKVSATDAARVLIILKEEQKGTEA